MTNIFIIHGSYGSPQENWFPWLKAELEKLGCPVFVLKFPTPEKQSLESWMKVFNKYEKEINDKSIVVGHSLGPAFLLSFLEKHRVKAAFFVAGFVGKLDNSNFDSINDTFVNKSF
ncbi:MAG: alpha/beta hydrolase, partial [Candidatus Woesearchaeota archaeon]